MRIRSVKPEFWAHEMHERISESAALLALALYNYADDEGRFKVLFKGMNRQLFTYRELKVPIEDAFAELVKERWLLPYKGVLDGREMTLCQIASFKDDQHINRPTKSLIPGRPRDGSLSPHVPLTESSLSPHVPLTGDGRKDIGWKEGWSEANLPAEPSENSESASFGEVNCPPSLEELLAFAAQKNAPAFSVKVCTEFWRYWQSRGWWLTRTVRMSDYRTLLEDWAEKKALDKKTPAPEAAPELAQLEAELEAAADPGQRAALREKIKKARGEA